jgi:hypothetical protein
MEVRLTLAGGILKAQVINRQSIEDTVEYLSALEREYEKCPAPKVLISVARSSAIFTLKDVGFDEWLRKAQAEGVRVALVGDTFAVQLSHQYVETIARIRGVPVRAFKSDAEAMRWLTGNGAARLVAE